MIFLPGRPLPIAVSLRSCAGVSAVLLLLLLLLLQAMGWRRPPKTASVQSVLASPFPVSLMGFSPWTFSLFPPSLASDCGRSIEIARVWVYSRTMPIEEEEEEEEEESRRTRLNRYGWRHPASQSHRWVSVPV